MPVIREYVVRNDFDTIVERGVELAPPGLATAEAKESLKLQAKSREFPSWRNDASYHWADIAKYAKENPEEAEEP